MRVMHGNPEKADAKNANAENTHEKGTRRRESC